MGVVNVVRFRVLHLSLYLSFFCMHRKLIYRIANSPLLSGFINTPSPQWLVFSVDLVTVILASWLTLHFNVNSTPEETSLFFSLWAKVGVITAIYALVMLITAPYRSIVRLSTFMDTYRVAITVMMASVIIAILEYVFNWTGTERYIGLWSIFVLGVITFALLVSMRLLIKYVFSNVVPENSRKRVVVLGSAINSFALASALLSEADGRFDPVLMLSIADRGKETTVNGIPIKHYNPDTVAKIFAEFKADTLLFLSTQIEFMRHGAADVFLNNHIKLLMLNQIEEFDLKEDGTSPNLSPHVQDIKIEDLLGREPIVTNNPAIASSIRDKTVLITGAAGSIGSELVRQVARHRPGRIILVDQAETPMHELQLEMEHKFPETKIKLCIADIVNKERMHNIFDRYRPQIIYHAAAYKHVPMMENNPMEAVQTNVFGTKNIADLAINYGAERFVMISTDKAVNPTNVMGASKRIAEIYVQSLAISLKDNPRAKTNFITTRFGNVLGSNGSVIPLFRKQIAEGGPVTVTHRDIIRYFMTIPEACSLVLEAGSMGGGGEIFIFDMGQPVKIYDLAKRMISLAGLKPNIDIPIVETGLRPGEKLFEELLNNHEYTRPTHHNKIMIAKVRTYDYADVCQRLNDLQTLIGRNNDHDLVVKMKCLVPEYVSQNSKFTKIDSEINDSDVIHEIAG